MLYRHCFPTFLKNTQLGSSSELEFNGTNQILVYADVNMLSEIKIT
jgi:hypothetical protein